MVWPCLGKSKIGILVTIQGRAGVEGSLRMSLEHKNNCASDTPSRRLSLQKRLLGRQDGPWMSFSFISLYSV